MSLQRLLRWAKNQRAPLWDPASSPLGGPVRFHSELRTAAQIMDVSRHQSQDEFDIPRHDTGAAA